MASATEHTQLFGALVSMYATQAMVALGKIGSPETGKIERNLEQAKFMIDLLGMIEAKTEGNRTDEETNALKQSLSMLRLNYVEESGKGDNATDDAPADTASADPAEATGDAPAAGAGSPDVGAADERPAPGAGP